MVGVPDERSLAAESPAPFSEVVYASAKAGILGLTGASPKERGEGGCPRQAVGPD